MHRHTVLFNLNDDLDDAKRDEVVATLRTLKDLPTVNSMILEKNLVPVGDMAPYEFVLMGDFNDQDARDAYEKHDTHVQIIRETFLPHVKNFAIGDVNF